MPNLLFIELFRPNTSILLERYTSCPIVVLFLASMMSRAADNVGKLKNSGAVATHPGLAEQSSGNIMHGGILPFVFLLLLA